MKTTYMHVKPTAALRREFAKWAVRHRIRTVESTTFGVPAALFPKIPEELLRGAFVDGQRYVPARAAAPRVPARAAKKVAPIKAAELDAGPAETDPVAAGAAVIGPENMPENIPAAVSPQVSPSEQVENHEPLSAADPVDTAPAPDPDTVDVLGVGGDEPDTPPDLVPDPAAFNPPQITDDDVVSPKLTTSDENWCEPCGRGFSTSHGLLTHTKMKHPDGDESP